MRVGRYLFTLESVTEGHPTNLSDKINIIMGAVIPQEKKKKLIPYIKSNLGVISQREIARRFGIGKTTVNRWSKEIGFKPVKYTFDEFFFDSWNEKSSYVLGIIFSDGNISWNPKKSYRSVTITASEKDKDHLEHLRNILSSTKPLLYYAKTKSYRLIITNKNLCLKLMKLGVTPRKSLKIKFPKIPKKYLKHFLRGVIDGDGNVRYVSRKRNPYFDITVSSGSKAFLEGMNKEIKKSIGIEAKVRKQKKNTYIIQYSCSRGKILAQFIYSKVNIFLKRKFQEYDTALRAGGGGQP